METVVRKRAPVVRAGKRYWLCRWSVCTTEHNWYFKSSVLFYDYYNI